MQIESVCFLDHDLWVHFLGVIFTRNATKERQRGQKGSLKDLKIIWLNWSFENKILMQKFSFLLNLHFLLILLKLFISIPSETNAKIRKSKNQKAINLKRFNCEELSSLSLSGRRKGKSFEHQHFKIKILFPFFIKLERQMRVISLNKWGMKHTFRLEQACFWWGFEGSFLLSYPILLIILLVLMHS